MTTYTFNETQSGVLTGVIRDDLGAALGSGDLSTLTLTITDQVTNEIINNRYRQDILNDNDATIDISGNLSWSIQADDNIIVGITAVPGDNRCQW